MSGRLRQSGWRLLPGIVTALVLGLLLWLSVLQPLEHIAYRVLFQVRGPLVWDERLVLIAIDDASLAQLGRFPWPRQRYVDLLETLTTANSTVVVMDLLWSEPSPDDAALAAAMTEHGQVIVAQAWDATGLPLLPTPQLQDAAIASGHILNRQDPDGITRTVAPLIRSQPALGIVAAQVVGLLQTPVALPPFDQPLWLNWPGAMNTLPHYSFVDVVEGRVPATLFRNKIVLVGVTATGIDPLITPFDSDPPASSVDLHATVLDNLLQQRWLTSASALNYALIFVLGGPLLSWVLVGWSTRGQLITVIGLAVSWLLLSAIAFHNNYLLPVATPIILVSSTGVMVVLIERLRENRLLQQQVAQLWNRYQDVVLPYADTLSPVISNDDLKRVRPSLERVVQLGAIAEQLGRSQSTQAAIARSLSIGLLASDLDGRVWFCNPVATQQFQLRVGDWLTTSTIPHGLSDAQWHSQLRMLMIGIPVPPHEFEYGDRWFQMTLEPLSYGGDRASSPPSCDGILLLLEDISPRKQIEANLNQQIQELHHLSLLKDDFLSTVSHELRAPMANIKMAIHMLKMAATPDTRERYLKILEEECRRETDLINDLLDLQRLEAGSKEIRTESFYIQEWLPPVVEPFFARTAARQQTLNLIISPHLPQITSDLLSLERLFIELINNACKYTPPHHTIRIQVVPIKQGVQFMVSNSGVEIAPTELPKIFDKFYRIPSSDRWKQGGTGLGLALVKQLVNYLQGTITVTSEANITQFIVQIPLSLNASTLD